MARTFESKACTNCLEVKPLTDFYKQRNYRTSRCRACLSAQRAGAYAGLTDEQKARYKRTSRAAKYGLTLEQYDELVERVTACAICLSPDPGPKGEWHIDHNHETGKVRGMLCQNCNLGLGLFRDNRANLERANAYLEVTDG